MRMITSFPRHTVLGVTVFIWIILLLRSLKDDSPGNYTRIGAVIPPQPPVVTEVRTKWVEMERRPIALLQGVNDDEHSRQLLGHSSLEKHKYRSDGLVEVNPNGAHPIFELIRDAEAAWDAKLKRSSKTLAEAVAEYKRRYKRLPPRGFDD
ncbi:hypothetical protein C0995_016690, partial [Termitomyces sp. Mi166